VPVLPNSWSGNCRPWKYKLPMPCVVQDGFPLVQAEMTCVSSQSDFYGCTAMACKLWSKSAQG